MIGFEFTIIDGNIGCTGHASKEIDKAIFYYGQDKYSMDNSTELWHIVIRFAGSDAVTITQIKGCLCDIWDFFKFERENLSADKIIAVCIG